MKRLLFSLAFVCAFSAYAQVPDCTSGTCAGVGVPSIACHPGNKYAQMDAAGTNWTCTGIPPHWVQDVGGGSSVSLTTTGTSGASSLSNGILNIPQYQGLLNLTTTGSSGAATLSGTTLNIPQYSGGASLPSAAQGQILSNSSGSTTYAGQGQILYNQSGDTIASIETACSSLCTYIVTTPQTITLAANHTLSSNVQLDFRAGGLWTVNGSFTLTIPGNVTGTLNQHFAGTSTIAFGPSQQYANVEWFGAVGDGSTNDYTAIQNTLNALRPGQAVLQTKIYNIAANTLSITKSNVGILGQNPIVTNTTQYTGVTASVIISSSASADILDAWGTSTSANIFGNKFERFTLARSVVPNSGLTGPPATGPAGLSLKYSYGAVIDRVASEDSGFGFFFHAVGAQGIGYINNSTAQWGYNGVTETTGEYSGFWFDSVNGEPSPSVRMTNDTAYANSFNPNNVNTLGLVLSGDAFNDFMGWNFETAHINDGTYINGTGATSIGAQDIHFRNFILDTCNFSCFSIINATSAMTSTIEIDGGWAEVTGHTAPDINIVGSNNIVVRGLQMVGDSGMTYAASVGTSNNVAFIGNNIRTATSGLLFTGGSDYTVSGNLIKASASGGALVSLASSPSHVSIGDNVFSGSATVGVSVAAGTSDVHGLETNNFDSTITTPISSAIPFLLPPTGSETVTYSATPTFSNITRSSYMALTGNVTSFTLPAGLDGQAKTMIFCQDATGGRTVTAPANVSGFVAITATASACSGEHFTYSAAVSKWQNDTLNAGGGGGSGTVNSGTANQLAMYASTGAAVSGDSLLTDNGTTLAYTGTGGITSNGPIGLGSSPPTACGSATGCLAFNEAGTAGTPTTGVDYIRADSTSHTLKYSVNGGAEASIGAGGGTTSTIASGTATLGTSPIASGACATVVTVTATGTASTDAITWNPNASIKAVTGYTPSTSGGLTITPYPTTNNVSFDVCNWTASSITPGAVTLNWRVTR